MGSTFTGDIATKSYIVGQPYPQPVGDQEWVAEIEAVERAVEVLLELKRTVLREDYRRESALWFRHIDVLRTIKRKLDAICV